MTAGADAAGWWPLPLPQEAHLINSEVAEWLTSMPLPTHFPIAIRIAGPLDLPAVESALRDVIRRHPGLSAAYLPTDVYGTRDRRLMLETYARTRLFVPGLLFGQRFTAVARIPIAHRRVTQPPDADEDDLLACLAADEARTPPRTDVAPVMRATVYSLDGDRHLLVLVVSHMVIDGWAAVLLRDEVIALYSARVLGQPCTLPPVTRHFGEFALAEHERLRSGAFAADADYWCGRAAEAADALVGPDELPSATGNQRGDRPSVQLVIRQMSVVDSSRVRTMQRQHRLTPYVLFRTAFTLLLHLYTQRARIAFWTNFSNRRDPGSEHMIGSCARAHVVSVDVSRESSVLDYCRAVGRSLAESQRHEAMPESALPLLGYPRRDARQSSVSFDGWPRRRREPGIATPVLIRRGRPWISFDVRFRDEGETFAWYIEYDERRFDTSAVGSIADEFLRLIAAMVANPERSVSTVLA